MSEQNEVARVLRDAADLIEPPGRWTRGTLARDEAGESVDPDDESAVCWCLYGALIRTSDADYNHDAVALLRQAVVPWLGLWNDDQVGAGPIVAALRAAADEAERSTAPSRPAGSDQHR